MPGRGLFSPGFNRFLGSAEFVEEVAEGGMVDEDPRTRQIREVRVEPIVGRIDFLPRRGEIRPVRRRVGRIQFGKGFRDVTGEIV